MPVRSDMKEMRRYGSASSLSMPRDLRLTSGDSMYSDDNKNDSMYVSSPDLSQGSHAHTRSSSTDSEGNFYGNHSRQSSGSTDHHSGRRTSTSNLRRTSTSQPDPLQFVKLKGANELAENAKKIIEATKEVNIMRNKVDTGSVSEEPDWQSNFNNWKSRRKSTHTRLGDDPFEETMEEEKKQHKTFGQILAEKENRENRRSLGPMNIYPLDDNDSGIGVKSSQESPISKTTGSRTESKPKGNKSKGSDVAPWAQDSSEDNISQSDSETNNSHQSGDTDSVFSDKSNPSKVLSDDDSWVKNKVNAQMVSNKITPPLRTQRSLGDTKKLWETNANESQKKDNKKIKDLPGNSAKIKNITQAFEQKEKEANTAPVIVKRSEFTRSRMTKSLDLSDRSFSTPLSPVDKKPPSPLSPTAPKALIPKEQRFSSEDSQSESQIPDNSNKKFTEQTIKINQKPNNEKGFGFVLVGGVEKKQPVTVQKVSLGSAADVCEVEANDELISINGRDVTTLTLAQVQGIVDHSVKRGQIELRVKRYLDEDQYDSVEENAFMENKASVKTSNNNNNNNNNNTMDAEINSHMSEPPDKHGHFKPTLQMSARSDEPPRLMDQLIEEQQREAINKQNLRAPSPEPAETFTPEAVVNSHSVPLQQTPTSHDMRAPDDVIISEERSTISKRRSPVNTVVHEDEPVVQMRKPRSPMVHDSPPPPTPPKSELPPLAQYHDTPVGENSGFGPPAALLRWQRPRPKSEYQAPISSPHTHQPSERTKRMSATLPYNADSKFTLDKDYSKDDSMIDKVSKPADNKPSVNRFNDISRFEEWEQKQEEQRMPEERSSTPPIEINMHKEEHLTAQEKFERDQQRIRLQYEEEKRQAKEAEKRKQEQEKKTLNADKFMRDMESQILQTKQEAANLHIRDNEPIRMSDTTPKFNSEPMTIRLSSNTPGRQLIIDPRNQTDNGDNMLPEYSFRVDLPKTESAPPLRTLDTGPSQEEILAREREKIREEEKRKFEEEQKRWKKEQEQKEQRLRQEQESIERQRQKLKEEQEQVEREKALLEQKARENDSYTSPYQPVNIQTYISPRSSAGSTGSPMSHSPKSPPALDPKYRESQSKKAAPPTAPKPDKGTKARLTRDDLLAMNRKATPLTKPEPLEHTASIGDNHLSPSTREPPSKGELHSLNAVPKQKFRSSAAWIKDEDVENDSPDERPFVIGKRSDLIHQRDYSNPSDHWLVREAEKRRLADSNSDYTNRRDNSESVTARAGPTKPSQSSLVSRFRGDVEPPPRTNRLSYPYSQSLDLHHSPKARPASTAGTSSRQYDRSPEPSTQFSAKTQPNSHAGNPSLSQTLPPNFSFSANARNPDGSATKPLRSLSTDDSGPVIAVSGKQKCSHCGEELGFGAAMVIESLGLYYHVQCFRCCVCRMILGNGSEGTDVRVRVNKLHCKNCYSNDEAGLKFSKV